MRDKKICIIGTGGFGRETLTCLIDSIAKTDLKIADIAVFMIPDFEYNEPEIMGIPVIRITSYNVCYTKLLRSRWKAGQVARNRGHTQSVGSPSKARTNPEE